MIAVRLPALWATPDSFSARGGGVGMGYSIHAGMVIVADGTDEAAARLSRVLRNDPGLGVIRHADAGYDIAKDTARRFGLNIK